MSAVVSGRRGPRLQRVILVARCGGGRLAMAAIPTAMGPAQSDYILVI